MRPSLEYLAGFLDGEGCICFVQNGRKRTSLSLRVSLVNTNLPVMVALQKEFGGSLSKPQNNRHKPLEKTRWHLHWYCEKAATLLDLLLPFLIVKKPQAELALVFRNVTTKRRLHKPLSHEDLKQNLHFHQQITELNKRGGVPTERGVDFKNRINSELAEPVN